jgi:uncharacterized phage-associated protein
MAFTGNREYDPARFEDLVLFIAWTMRDEPRFGRLKLAKTLFYVDFDAYAGEGESITGSTYEHWEHGPFPPQLYDVERKLVREGRATIKDPQYKGDEAKLLPTREPAVPFEEWVEVVAATRARNLAQEPSWAVEDASHRHRGWELTDDDEAIPYETHFIPSGRQPLPADTLEWARGVVRGYEAADT